MMNLSKDIAVWLISWSFIGSSLGFFTLRNKPQWTKYERFCEYLKSISVGIFFAFPTFIYLKEENIFSQPINLMIAGSLAFAITDIIIQIWPKFIEGVSIVFTKLIEKWLGIGNNQDGRK